MLRLGFCLPPPIKISGYASDLDRMSNSVAQLHLSTAPSQMSSPIGKYLHYLLFYISSKQFYFDAD